MSLILLLTACGHELSRPADPTDTSTCTTDKLGDGGDLFDVATLHEVRITLSEASLTAINRDPRTYALGAVEVDGDALETVGVRLKGSTSFQELDGKPSFKLKFNEYCEGQKLAGLKRLTLNNMVSDPTQSQEMLNYQLWAAAGLKAPRASYAEVWLNGELYGLYSNVESMDDEWVQRRYADDSGDLWEAGSGAEFSAEGLDAWDLKEGDGDRDALQAVADALDAPGAVFANLDGVVGMDQFLTYWAWKVVVGDPDGYPWHPNDIFLYADPAQGGRFEFSPWGFDEAWQDYVDWQDADGRLATACLADQDCADRFHARVVTAVDTFETLDAVGWLEAAWALSAPVLPDDARRPYTVAEVEAAREALRATVEGRAAQVRDDL